MTWSYDSALLTTKDQVRFLIGDTDTDAQLVQNEEIDWALSTEGNIYSAAALVATTIASTFASKVEVAVGDLKLRYSDQFKHYGSLAAHLRTRVLLAAPAISAGADNVSTKEGDEQDTSLVQPAFRREMMENRDKIDTTSRWLS